jgi:excinuclease UvrABC ATPase subunit
MTQRMERATTRRDAQSAARHVADCHDLIRVQGDLQGVDAEGACPTCNGAGVVDTDLAMMAGVATTCEDCEGKRFEASVLQHRLGGRDISELLAMSVLGLLERLVDSGQSVIVIAHHQAVMARADWIVDLGPGAGHDGGRVVFEGTPADLVAARSTPLTGEHLPAYVGA